MAEFFHVGRPVLLSPAGPVPLNGREMLLAQTHVPLDASTAIWRFLPPLAPALPSALR